MFLVVRRAPWKMDVTVAPRTSAWISKSSHRCAGWNLSNPAGFRSSNRAMAAGWNNDWNMGCCRILVALLGWFIDLSLPDNQSVAVRGVCRKIRHRQPQSPYCSSDRHLYQVADLRGVGGSVFVSRDPAIHIVDKCLADHQLAHFNFGTETSTSPRQWHNHARVSMGESMRPEGASDLLWRFEAGLARHSVGRGVVILVFGFFKIILYLSKYSACCARTPPGAKQTNFDLMSGLY